MSNPCCCVPSGPCPDNVCYKDPECAFCVPEPYPCPWGADALYAALVAHFGAAAYVDMGVINMRLAIPFEPFSWGCWDTDETDTCCGRYNTCLTAPTNCTNYVVSKMRVECLSAFNSSQIGNTEFRAIQFAPNQFNTNCRWCGIQGNGYYTNGLPTVDQFWPRCDDCASRVPASCTFTGSPMPDITFVDGNNPMNAVPAAPILPKEPANTGLPCCDVVNIQCQDSSSPRRARFFQTNDGTGNPYVMTKYPGSPHPCEAADYRDVYMAKELFLLPNVAGSGNCIRIVFHVRMYHFFQARLPGIAISVPGYPPPCSCNDPGLSYVNMGCQGTASHQPHFVYGEAWYYLDLQGNETLVEALSKPLRKFWVLQNPPCFGVHCAAEEGLVVLNSYTGCECSNPNSNSCLNVQHGPCSDGTGLYTDCTDYNVPEYLEQEVPCTPTDSGIFPHVVPNTHFSFPDRVFIS